MYTSYILYRNDIIAVRDDDHGYCLYKSLQDSNDNGNEFYWVFKIGSEKFYRIGEKYHLEDVHVALLMKVKFNCTEIRNQITINPKELANIQHLLDKSKTMYPDDVVEACSDDGVNNDGTIKNLI